MKITNKAKRLTIQYNKLYTKLTVLGEEIQKEFYPLIDSAYFEEGEEAAFEVMRQMPFCIHRAFAVDRIKNILPKIKK